RLQLSKNQVDSLTIQTTQMLRQKNWEHSFIYGIDYWINEKQVVNFYSNLRCYSNETDGYLNQLINSQLNWSAAKEEEDSNRSGYYSLYYKNSFDPVHELSLDVSYNHYQRTNFTTYLASLASSETAAILNELAPHQGIVGVRLDYALPISEGLKAGVGTKLSSTVMRERSNQAFDYSQQIVAVYTTASYHHKKFLWNGGLR